VVGEARDSSGPATRATVALLEPAKNRPSVWKAFALSFGFLAASLVARLVPWFALSSLGEKSLVRSSLTGLVALSAAVALTLLPRRRLPDYEHPELVVLPRLTGRGTRVLLLAGVVGVLLFAIVFVLARVTGGIQIEPLEMSPLAWVGSMGAVLVITILNAAWEEFTFRGWPFSSCVRAFGPHGVSAALGTVFGLAHLLNPTWTPAAILSTALAGLLICYSMLAFRNLLVPIGLHVGWNCTQSSLTSTRFWKVTWHPNPWLSGGRYGLEACLPGLVVTGLASALSFTTFILGRRKREAGLQ
jgi:membrane protease YdiL (CAAX protease family)